MPLQNQLQSPIKCCSFWLLGEIINKKPFKIHERKNSAYGCIFMYTDAYTSVEIQQCMKCFEEQKHLKEKKNFAYKYEKGQAS